MSPSRVATAVSIITASMACSTRGTPSTRPAITRPLSNMTMHALVALGAVGPHDRLAGPRRRGPVDAAELVVRPVLAQLLELGAAAEPAGRPQAHLQDAAAADLDLGLVPGPERRVHPQHGRDGHLALAGPQAEGPLDPQRHVLQREPAPAQRRDGGRDPGLVARREPDREPSGRRPAATGPAGRPRGCRSARRDSERTTQVHRRPLSCHHHRRVTSLQHQPLGCGAERARPTTPTRTSTPVSTATPPTIGTSSPG